MKNLHSHLERQKLPAKQWYKHTVISLCPRKFLFLSFSNKEMPHLLSCSVASLWALLLKHLYSNKKKKASVATDSERGDCCESNCSTNLRFRASWRGCRSISGHRLLARQFGLKNNAAIVERKITVCCKYWMNPHQQNALKFNNAQRRERSHSKAVCWRSGLTRPSHATATHCSLGNNTSTPWSKKKQAPRTSIKNIC